MLLRPLKVALVGAVVIAALAVVFSRPAFAHRLAASCTTKAAARIQLSYGTEFCGPAVVRLHTAGKTFTYRKGFCDRSPTGGVVINMGVKSFSPGTTNHHKPEILIGDVKSGAEVFGAFFGGKLLVDVIPIHVHGTLLKATFKGGPAQNNKPFSGSWHCGRLYNGI